LKCIPALKHKAVFLPVYTIELNNKPLVIGNYIQYVRFLLFFELMEKSI